MCVGRGGFVVTVKRVKKVMVMVMKGFFKLPEEDGIRNFNVKCDVSGVG